MKEQTVVQTVLYQPSQLITGKGTEIKNRSVCEAIVRAFTEVYY